MHAVLLITGGKGLTQLVDNAVVAFIDILEQVLDAVDARCDFHVDVAIHQHKQRWVVWHYPFVRDACTPRRVTDAASGVTYCGIAGKRDLLTACGLVLELRVLDGVTGSLGDGVRPSVNFSSPGNFGPSAAILRVSLDVIRNPGALTQLLREMLLAGGGRGDTAVILRSFPARAEVVVGARPMNHVSDYHVVQLFCLDTARELCAHHGVELIGGLELLL